MPREKSLTTTPRKRAPRKELAITRIEPAKLEPARVEAGVPKFVDPEQRAALIAEAAYFRAEKRGFEPGYETADWLAAEAEVDARLLQGAAAPGA